MQSLSGIDTHKPIKDYPQFWMATPDMTKVNTDEMIGWSEPDCEACNDHPGEGEFRMDTHALENAEPGDPPFEPAE
jgi:hypothetical protein